MAPVSWEILMAVICWVTGLGELGLKTHIHTQTNNELINWNHNPIFSPGGRLGNSNTMINQSLLSNSLLSIEWIPFSSLCVCLQRQADFMSAYLDVLSSGGVTPSVLGSDVVLSTDTPAAPGDPTGDEAAEPVDKPHVYIGHYWTPSPQLLTMNELYIESYATRYWLPKWLQLTKKSVVSRTDKSLSCFIMPRF